MKIIVQRGPKKAQHFWKNPKFFSLSETFPPFQLLKIGPGNFFGACYEWFGLTTEQRGELVDFYLAEKSVLETKPACCNHLNVRGAPDRSTVWRIVKMLSV